MSGQRITPAIGFGYGLGAFGLMLFNLTISIFLLYFYTDVVGLSSTTAGYIILVAMFWDGVTDPLMGVIADRTDTRWGKYRPYLLFGAPALLLAFLGVFAQPALSPAMMIVYACAATLAYRTVFTVLYMPHTSMIAAMTADYRERSTLTGYKTFFVSLGGVFVSASVLFLVEAFGEGSEARGFARTAGIVGLLAVLSIWACFWLTRERGNDSETRTSKYNYTLTQFLDVSVRNRPFMLVFAASFAFLVGWNCLWQTIVYYFKYVVGDAAMASIALTAFHVSQALAAFGWALVTQRRSKRFVWIAGALISIGALLVLAAWPSPSATTAAALITAFGVGTSAFLVTYFSALADTVDYGEARTGVRCEALLFGALAFATKASFGIASGIVGNALAIVGFQPNVEQSAAALSGIKYVFTLLPVAGLLVSIGFIWFYELDRTRHGRLLTQIRVADASRARASDA